MKRIGLILIYFLLLNFIFSQEKKSLSSPKLLIIMPKDCVVCDTKPALRFLKKVFFNLKEKRISQDNDLAKRLIKEFKVKLLPAYFLEKKSLQDEKEGVCRVCGREKMLKEGKDFYYILPYFTGGSFFINRKRIPNRLDIFFTPYSPLSLKIVDLIKKLKKRLPSLKIKFHFLTPPKEKNFSFLDQYELEEALRSVCVAEKFKDKLLDYLECRLKQNNTTFWEDCLERLDIWPKIIKKCALSKEGQLLLEKNTKLNKELQVITGPYILLENQQIFGITQDTTVEELIKIIKREVKDNG